MLVSSVCLFLFSWEQQFINGALIYVNKNWKSAFLGLDFEVIDVITLTIAHLKIALLGGNSEVGNSEYINHQNCPPQLLCIFSVNMAIGWVLEAYDVYSK